MYTVFIPIIFIGGLFLVFFVFKDKFQGKAKAAYAEATKRWENREEVISGFFADDNKFGMLQKSVGEKKIESLCWGRTSQNMAGKTLKKGLSMLVGYESFDMNAYYLAIAGDELHYLCSNGEQIYNNEVFPFAEIKDLQFSTDNKAKSIAKTMLKGEGSNVGTFTFSFRIDDEKYSFSCEEGMDSFAKFKVEKEGSGGRGQNPFFRITEGATDADDYLLGMYSAESVEKFKSTLRTRV